MQAAYPVIITEENGKYIVDAVDFGIHTYGESIYDAMVMGRDAISLTGIVWEDEKREIPAPSDLRNIECPEGAFLTYIDIDFAEYRRELDEAEQNNQNP